MTYERSPAVLETEVNGSPVVMHTANWEYMQFNPVGVAIWKLLAKPQTIDSLVEALRGEFRVDETTCHRDTSLMLEKLLAGEYLTAKP